MEVGMKAAVASLAVGVIAVGVSAWHMSSRAEEARAKLATADFLNSVASQMAAEDCAENDASLYAFYSGRRVNKPLALLKAKSDACSADDR
jgi:hypothetical protein